jgi:hypothetical protein
VPLDVCEIFCEALTDEVAVKGFALSPHSEQRRIAFDVAAV